MPSWQTAADMKFRGRIDVWTLSDGFEFGVGSIAGMMIMSLLMGLPLYVTAERFVTVNKGIRFLAGAFSLVWGALLINEKFFT